VPALVNRRLAPVSPRLTGPVTAAGEGEDRTGRRTIPVFGGLVTVSGEKMPRGTTVMVMGRPVPLDPGGRFVTDLVLPPGTQNVDVSLAAPGQAGVTLTRQISIPRSDWFSTGLADLTIGRRDTALSGREGYTRGRLAFYAKGLLQDGTQVTSAFDSGEDQLGHLFADVLSKRPRSVLDRIGDDNPYLTYGDDSTAVDDAPTSGKLYLKVEKDGNHLGWGDFKAGIDHSAFLSASRNLYGVQGAFGSPAITDAGERRFHVTGYAAQPESLPQRDELRGTGGSVYMLKRRDLVPGSESLRVEIVDPVTGRVVSSRPLTAEGYRIDYFQGRVILAQPLSAEAASGGVVTEGTSGGHAINLVAQYEYVPVVTDLDGTAFGGRVEGWLPGDTFRLGLTAMDETTDSADLSAHSADVRYQLAPESFVDLEVAESTGTGFGRSVSTDGGFTWNEVASAGGSERARAFRLGADIDLSDVAAGANGRLKAWYQDKDAGFQTLSENLAADQIDWGLGIETRIAERLGLSLGYEDFESGDGNRRQTGEATLSYNTSARTTVELGVKLRDEVQAGDAEDTGRRVYLGMKISRALRFDQKVYVTAQTTVARSGGIRRNDRLGFGGTVNLGRALTAEAEASDGTAGPGSRARLTYRAGDTGLLYLGYELDPEREIAGTSLNGDHRGRWLLGAKHQVNDRTSYFAEDSYDLFGERKALTQAYGVTYTPSEVWSFSANLERGSIVDANDADSDYMALSLGTGYGDGDGVQGKARLEYRVEAAADPNTQDRTTWGFLGNYSHQVSADWRMTADVDVLISDSDRTSFPEGRYVEASLGYAWRPVEDDRWNVLARYTFLYDLPGAGQIGADGTSATDKQRSQILSLAAIYDPGAAWEFGGKLAYRKGETAPQASDVFTSSDAGLAALRASYGFLDNWEIAGETRFLWLPDVDQTRTGNLLTVYRDFGETVKIGVGYNFGAFSDDLRDTTLDEKGVFLNFQALLSSQ